MFLSRMPGRAFRLLFLPGRRRRLQAWLRHRRALRMPALAEEDMRLGRCVARTRPAYLVLDPGPVCNLRCRFCPTGNGEGSLAREFLAPDTFAKLVKNLPLDTLCEANLFNWGEPLLNPHLNAYIRFFADLGIQTVVHANFSARDYDDAWLEALVRSGLHRFVASVDGASQETYGAYRVGGDFDRVLRNLAGLVRARGRLGMTTPQVRYKMILSRVNQHEVETARQLAASAGAEFELQEVFGMPEAFREEWLSDSAWERGGTGLVSAVDAGGHAPVPTECRQMWDTVVVNANGDMHVCCQVHRPGCAVGNLLRDPFEEVWNGEKMRALRGFVLNGGPAPGFENFCASCAFLCHAYRRAHGESAGPRGT